MLPSTSSARHTSDSSEYRLTGPASLRPWVEACRTDLLRENLAMYADECVLTHEKYAPRASFLRRPLTQLPTATPTDLPASTPTDTTSGVEAAVPIPKGRQTKAKQAPLPSPLPPSITDVETIDVSEPTESIWTRVLCNKAFAMVVDRVDMTLRLLYTSTKQPQCAHCVIRYFTEKYLSVEELGDPLATYNHLKVLKWDQTSTLRSF